MKKRERILIVDDDEFNRELLCGHAEIMGFSAIKAVNGKEAIEKAITEKPDLIIMDVMMPVMDGFDATQTLKAREITKHIPIIIATTLDSREEMFKGISLGADDYLTKPIDTEELKIRLNNNLIKKRYHDLLEHQNETLQKKVFEKTREIHESFIETTHRLTLSAEYKDPETGEHIKRICRYTQLLSRQMGQSQDFVDTIFHASSMHDIGKVGIPDSILLKNGPLDADEFKVMKTHSFIGAKILQNSRSALLRMAEEIAYTHHERWDGKGYPRGLKQTDIPLTGRIMNICDQYDALRSKRPYKPSFSHEKTMDIIMNGDGRTHPSHFDPEVLKAFGQVSKTFDQIFNEFIDSE